MSPSRLLTLFTVVLLGFVCVAGLSGCGGADEGASSARDGAGQPVEIAREFEGRPDYATDERSSDVSVPGAQLDRLDASATRSMPETIVRPFAAEGLGSSNTSIGDTATSGGASPPPSASSVPKMAVRTLEMESASPVTAPRLVAPSSIAPTREPQLAVRSMAGGAMSPASTPRMMAPSMESAEPRMAEISLEPTAGEISPEPLAMEMAASPVAADEARPAARAPVAEDRGDYDAVTVFYGTDRSSSVTSGQPDEPHRLWLYGAGICVLLFGLFSLVAMSSTRKKTFASLAVMTFSAGCVLAVMGTIAWLQSDRAVAGPKLEYGNGRGSFVMGTCEVSIPRNHQVAELEAPSVFKLDFVEDPTRHVALLDIEEQDSETFFSQLRARVDQGVSKDAFVFVHGFNVTFEDAARRTAQLTYDLKFQGAPIFYSWPSQGGLFQYAVDETNVVWTVPHLREFLKEIASQSGAQSVHLIAHSMGNRALTSALRELAFEMRGMPPLFNEVVLTAPDIDAEIFRRDIAPAIVTTAKRVTLYASSNDEALVLSKQVHGYPRAGETGDGLVVIPGIETVDVSAVDTSLLGHSYYGDNATVISDMIDLVRNSKSARERSWLETARLDELFYWVFRADRGAVGAAPAETPSRY